MNAKAWATQTMGQSLTGALETITSTDDLPALSAKHVALKTILGRIAAASAAQSEPVNGPRRVRNRALASATDLAIVVAGAVLSYARERGLDELIVKVDVTPTSLKTGRLARRVELLQQIHAAATSVLSELADFRVTAAMLTQLQELIDVVKPLLVAPRARIVSRRVATLRLEKEHRRLMRLITGEIDPLVEGLRLTSPDDYARYHAARVVVDSPGSPAADVAPPAVTATAAGLHPAAPVAIAA